MTDQDKAKAYDKVVLQRDVYRDLLCEFIDEFRNLTFNGMHRAFHNDGKEIETFGKTFDEIHGELSKADERLAWEIGKVFRILNEAGVKLNEQGLPAEIKAVVDKVIDLPKAKEYLDRYEPSLEGQKGRFNATDEDICYSLITFFWEYQFGHEYPADENEIYKDVFRHIMLCMMSRCNIHGSKQGMLDFVSEYRAKKQAEQKK